MRPSNLAILAIVYRQPEAAVLVSMLRAYGIPAFAPVWGLATVLPQWTVQIGGIVVLVPTVDLEAAIELAGDPADLPPPPLPVRGGAWRTIVFALTLWFVTGVLMPPRIRGSYATPMPSG